jgi:hypothetical protein
LNTSKKKKKSSDIGNNNQNNRKSKVKGFIKDYGQFITGILISLITVFLVCIAYKQVEISNKATNATLESVEIADSSMRIANRAYLSLSKITPQKIKNFKNITVEVSIINTGQTPAYDIQSWSILAIRTACLDTVLGRSTSVQTTIAGKNETIYNEKTISTSEAQIEKIKNGKLFINFTGTVIYRDIFNQQHFFKYNFIYSVKSEGFIYCPKHNDAD